MNSKINYIRTSQPIFFYNYDFLVDKRIFVRYDNYTNKCSGVKTMQLPIEMIHPTTMSPLKKFSQTCLAYIWIFWRKIQAISNTANDFERFRIQPQMPRQQISHCVKKAIRLKQPIIIQVNELDDVVSEIIGYPYISPDSSHLILKSFNQQTSYVIKGSSIRHIQQLYQDIM